MAKLPSNWSVKDVLSVVRELTNTAEQQKILSEQGKYFYKLALSEIVTLLNGSLDPSYFVIEQVVPSTTPLVVLDANQQSNGINVVSTATNTIRTAGVALPINTHFVLCGWNADTNYKGSILGYGLTWHAPTNKLTYRLKAAQGGSIDMPSLDPNRRLAFIVNVPSTDISIDLNLLSKPYDRVVAVIDSLWGVVVPVSPSEYFSIGRSDFAHKSYDDDVIYTQIGDTLLIRHGASNASQPGTKTIIYQRQPDVSLTAWDDTVKADISDKFVPLLVKRIYTYIMLQVNNDIPQNLHEELTLDYAAISNYASSEVSNRLMKEKGLPAGFLNRNPNQQ